MSQELDVVLLVAIRPDGSIEIDFTDVPKTTIFDSLKASSSQEEEIEILKHILSNKPVYVLESRISKNNKIDSLLIFLLKNNHIFFLAKYKDSNVYKVRYKDITVPIMNTLKKLNLNVKVKENSI